MTFPLPVFFSFLQTFSSLQWVTENDLTSMAKGLGVKNIADIKFAEDRSNGVSRG